MGTMWTKKQAAQEAQEVQEQQQAAGAPVAARECSPEVGQLRQRQKVLVQHIEVDKAAGTQSEVIRAI